MSVDLPPLDEMTPFSPVDEVPLHSPELPDRGFWACSAPERPPDDRVIYDLRCPRCVVAAEAALVTHWGELFSNVGPEQAVRLIKVVAFARARLDATQ